MENPHSILKKVFGYDSFRPGQEDIVRRLLDGQDVLAVMPTGAGKSICYQVPALLLPGITIVVSPLVSLMKDQVGALVQAGVAAAFLNNSLTDNQKALMLRRAREGWYKIIYVAPERLEMPGFQRFAQERPISMVTVDEAHCISQWGQDFRPSYLRIKAFVDSLPSRPVVGAFTATATAHVRDDIREQLALQKPYEVTTSFDRPNLYFETRRALPSQKPKELLDLVLKEGDNAGIVYCSTTKQVDETARLLQSRGIRAAAYHAKLDADTRRKNQDDFLYDRVQVMVATNAFGMGITGRSGSGKSTFLRLLMRFWDVSSGSIRFGAEDIRRVNTAALREQESLVTQETELFDDTIENNIRIAKRDAIREEVEAACKKAALDGFIHSLPKGYDTPVGELGGALSGGERQRIGVARAFLHDAPFLLLDEPTSNLDSLNEGVILKAVRAECKDKTVLLVSHRKSTMAAADISFSVESGRLS